MIFHNGGEPAHPATGLDECKIESVKCKPKVRPGLAPKLRHFALTLAKTPERHGVSPRDRRQSWEQGNPTRDPSAYATECAALLFRVRAAKLKQSARIKDRAWNVSTSEAKSQVLERGT